MKKAKKAKKAQKSVYNASIKVLGKVYTASGDTILGALSNLKPGIAKGMSVITVSHDGKTQDRILPAVQTTRVFNPSPTMRVYHLKNLSLRFDL